MIEKFKVSIVSIIEELLCFMVILLGILSPFFALATKSMLYYYDTVAVRLDAHLPQPMRWFSNIQYSSFYAIWAFVAAVVISIYCFELVVNRKKKISGNDAKSPLKYCSIIVSIIITLFFLAVSLYMIIGINIYLTTILKLLVRK